MTENPASPVAGHNSNLCPICQARLTCLEGSTGTIRLCSRCGWKEVQRKPPRGEGGEEVEEVGGR